jgi:hypothetical protein
MYARPARFLRRKTEFCEIDAFWPRPDEQEGDLRMNLRYLATGPASESLIEKRRPCINSDQLMNATLAIIPRP